jgi:DNA-binding NtrC family response regulator
MGVQWRNRLASSRALHLPKQTLKGRNVMDINKQVNGRRLKDAVRAFEREYIMLRLKENQFDKRKTAEELHIALSSLYRKLAELHIGEQEELHGMTYVPGRTN